MRRWGHKQAPEGGGRAAAPATIEPARRQGDSFFSISPAHCSWSPWTSSRRRCRRCPSRAEVCVRVKQQPRDSRRRAVPAPWLSFTRGAVMEPEQAGKLVRCKHNGQHHQLLLWRQSSSGGGSGIARRRQSKRASLGERTDFGRLQLSHYHGLRVRH